MIKIIDDFLPKSFQDDMEEVFRGQYFPWFYYHSTYSNDIVDLTKISIEEKITGGAIYDDQTKESSQFVHTFYTNNEAISGQYAFTKGIIYFMESHGIKLNILDRLKVNMMLKDNGYPDDYHNMAHSDTSTRFDGWQNSYTLLYYPIDSDGDTFFFDQKLGEITPDTQTTLVKRVSPKKGRAVLFESCRLHASSPPKINEQRLALNVVFRGELNG